MEKFNVLDPDFERTANGFELSGAYLSAKELKSIARYMTYAIDRTEKQLERWQNHPTDQGQAKYSEKRDELRKEIELFKDILKFKTWKHF